MVEEDNPHPAPRPSPDMATDVDAAMFNQRWETARVRALKTDQSLTMKGPTMTQDSNRPRRPEETLREGPLKAAIWRNEGEHGPYHSVTLSRTYKDREGNLHDTQSFRPKDMLGLSELARRAHHNVHEHEQTAFKERRMAQQEQAQIRTRGHSH